LITNAVGGSRPSESEFPAIEQKTLTSTARCVGIGLHSGKTVEMAICPAEPGAGITIRRTDVVNGGAHIPLNWRHIVDSRLATTVGNGYGITVSTVEHLMAALAGCEIDNAIVEVDGPELPIMDGSARPFVAMIEQAGTRVQDAPRRMIRIEKRVTVGDHEKSLSLTPARAFSLSFEIDFESSSILRQELKIHMGNGAFKSDIAGARTFGFAHEVDQLRSVGLALGGSLENAIVIEGDHVLNEEGLRFQDEFVRHKILDCIGDLYLAGAPIIGHVHGARSGHALNHALLEALFEDDDAWTYVEPGIGDRQRSARPEAGAPRP
jgi:UDP-3-O-[3-hydroxymyristoyl] N-acetylglucosamine deacetylase